MDRYKLEYEMKSKGVTVEELCKAIGMSKAAYYRKLNSSQRMPSSQEKTCIIIN